jgi:hypothetical protein
MRMAPYLTSGFKPALTVIRILWCAWRDSNSHDFRHRLLRPAWLPLHHTRIKLIVTTLLSGFPSRCTLSGSSDHYPKNRIAATRSLVTKLGGATWIRTRISHISTAIPYLSIPAEKSFAVSNLVLTSTLLASTTISGFSNCPSPH